MKHLVQLAIFVFASSCFASSPDAELSITRPFAPGGGYGSDVTEMSCSGADTLCSVRKIANGKITVKKKLPHDKGTQIVARLAAELKKIKPAAPVKSPSDANPMTWSFEFQGKRENGELPAQPEKTDPTFTALTRAEAQLMKESK